MTVLSRTSSNSTPLGESLDHETIRALMGRYFERMTTVIERHGGTVEKYIGDAIMAVFGIPAVHEDDALRAVRAATEMREALADLNAELEHPLSIRIGLNTGEVVAGEGHTLVTGDAVNVAARLEQAADSGEIVIGAATHALVRDAVVAAPLEPLTLKGKSSPVSAWRVTAVLGGAPGRARRLDAALVGRDREVQLLAQALARVTGTRSSHLFTIVGPAGVGKSRLASEFLAAARDDNAMIVTGRCLPYGDGVTFWPLRDVIDAVGDVATLIGERDAEVIAGTIGTVEAPAPTADTFRAVRRLIEALARDRPVILMFEDVHWAEPTFLDLVEHLADRLREVPVLFSASPARSSTRSGRRGRRQAQRHDDPARVARRRRIGAPARRLGGGGHRRGAAWTMSNGRRIPLLPRGDGRDACRRSGHRRFRRQFTRC